MRVLSVPQCLSRAPLDAENELCPVFTAAAVSDPYPDLAEVSDGRFAPAWLADPPPAARTLA